MNENHLQQIFKNYIDHFEEVNNTEHREYYKWRIARQFRPMMEDALQSDKQEFIAKLKKIKKLTGNFIDSYTQPLGGLIRFSEKWGEAETVQEMFRQLFQDDGGDLNVRQQKMEAFLEQSHALNNKYEGGIFRYKDDFHSVTGYLFLYDPDHNYIYKASHVQSFADCVEFYDDFGVGDHVKLQTYYRMCDELVAAIKADEALMKTDASRFENGWGVDPETLYPDKEKHILAFDLIYCCSTYNLFRGITYVRPKTKERQLMQEKKDKAKELLEKLESARKRQEAWDEAAEYADSVLCVGAEVRNRAHGKGHILQKNENTIAVVFEDQHEQTFGIWESVAGGYITSEDKTAAAHFAEIKTLLGEKTNIESAVSRAEKNFEPYSDFV